ncbi:hypothetical protein [Enterococcus sp. N249-2]
MRSQILYKTLIQNKIEVETQYYFKGSSCLSLFIEQVEGEHDQYNLSSEYERLFTGISFGEVVNEYKKIKSDFYA